MTLGSFFACSAHPDGTVVVLMSADICVALASKIERGDDGEFFGPLVTMAAQIQARTPTHRPAA